jgi:hypothetical protein
MSEIEIVQKTCCQRSQSQGRSPGCSAAIYHTIELQSRLILTLWFFGMHLCDLNVQRVGGPDLWRAHFCRKYDRSDC